MVSPNSARIAVSSVIMASVAAPRALSPAAAAADTVSPPGGSTEHTSGAADAIAPAIVAAPAFSTPADAASTAGSTPIKPDIEMPPRGRVTRARSRHARPSYAHRSGARPPPSPVALGCGRLRPTHQDPVGSRRGGEDALAWPLRLGVEVERDHTVLAAPVQDQHRGQRAGDAAERAQPLGMLGPAADVGGGEHMQADL